MGWLDELGSGVMNAVTGGLSGAVGAGMGLLLEDHNDQRALNMQEKFTNMQIAGQERLS